MSLSVDPNNNEILAGTSLGNIYRVYPDDLSATLHTEGHVSSIKDVAFMKGNNDIFASITSNGIMRVWETEDLTIVTRGTPGIGKGISGESICIAEDRSVVTGWSDGFIRCYEITKHAYSPL